MPKPGVITSACEFGGAYSSLWGHKCRFLFPFPFFYYELLGTLFHSHFLGL